MVTGEDIVAEVVSIETDTENYYILNNPMKVVYLSTTKSSSLSISLTQWIFWRICDKQEFTIHPKDILVVNDVSIAMEDYYWSSMEHFESYKEELLNSDTDSSDEVLLTEKLEDNDEIMKSVIEMLRDTKRILH
jgi:hypothetical protein